MLQDCCVAFTHNLQLLFQPLGPNQLHRPSALFARGLGLRGSTNVTVDLQQDPLPTPQTAAVMSGWDGPEKKS